MKKTYLREIKKRGIFLADSDGFKVTASAELKKNQKRHRAIILGYV